MVSITEEEVLNLSGQSKVLVQPVISQEHGDGDGHLPCQKKWVERVLCSMRLRQKPRGFKVILSYIMNSRTSCTTQDPVSKQNEAKQSRKENWVCM